MNIIFQNDGDLDPLSIKTFGCSVKQTNNPIGFFGTGLKYALAVLLRTGHSVTLQTAGMSMEFGVQPVEIRGTSFKLVTLKGEPLGFTTDLGKLWENWMAYRELYCNSKDEPGGVVFESNTVPPVEQGKTRLIVSGPEIVSSHNKRNEFILEDRVPDFVLGGGVEIFDRPSTYIYYRGIRVSRTPTPSMFTYNLTCGMELTEDRTLKEPSQAYYKIARAVLSTAPVEVLERILLASRQTLESSFDYHGWSTQPSEEFLKTVGNLCRDNIGQINPTALRVYRDRGLGFNIRKCKLTRVQEKQLIRAIDFCERIGFPLRDEYPIIVVESLGSAGHLAMADRRTQSIYITVEVFSSGGTKAVASALIEEYLHLKHNLDDCTRELQNFLFNRLVSLGEEVIGEPL